MNFYPLGAKRALNLNSEIETADSADFTDFEEVIGEDRTNLLWQNLAPELGLDIDKFYWAGNGKRRGEDARPTMRPLLV